MLHIHGAVNATTVFATVAETNALCILMLKNVTSLFLVPLHSLLKLISVSEPAGLTALASEGGQAPTKIMVLSRGEPGP